MINFPIWGDDGIDDQSRAQMRAACALPVALRGALMADAHLGYGLPIGGVLALDNAVCPFAVGVDIACRMKMSIFEITAQELKEGQKVFTNALEYGTFFGVGVENTFNYDHPVLHEDWSVSLPTWQAKDRAAKQLGTSGSGNHFAEFGTLEVFDDGPDGMPAEAKYVALMTHSGSRGAGAAVCNYFSRLAKSQLPEHGDLAWLDLDSDAGKEYWAAMELMGRYAAANHDCIHNQIATLIGTKPVAQIENHHNFAWKEQHAGREMIVHRKGATPAGKGVLGVIPGSMGTPAYVVEGLGNGWSLNSASHGAGRVMSRTQAKKTFDYKTEIAKLAERGITVLSAGADEVCGVYKNIDAVMAEQHDLVRTVAKFEPKIVKMCGSNDRAED